MMQLSQIFKGKKETLFLAKIVAELNNSGGSINFFCKYSSY